MKGYLIAAALLTLFAAAFLYFQSHPVPVPEALTSTLTRAQKAASQATERARAAVPAPSVPAPQAAEPDARRSPVSALDPAKTVTLYLNNGGAITGELVRESEAEVVIRWEVGEIGFQRSEIARIERPAAGTSDRP